MTGSATKTQAVAKAGENPLVAKLEALQKEYGPAALAAVGEMTRAVMLARGIEEIRKVLRELLPLIMPLVGRPLGFLTDRDNAPDKGPYGDDVIVECCTEAVLRGLRWTNNEFNIISSRTYTTLNGFARLVREIPGLTNLEVIPGVPKMFDGGAVVSVKASWRLNGVPKSFERSIPVRLNKAMGADGALGKARRKALADVWAISTGSETSEEDAAEPGEGPPLLADGRADDLKARLRAGVEVEPAPAGGQLSHNPAAGKLPD